MHKVLAVDDSALIQAVYKQHFKKMRGVDLRSARNGKEALEAMQEEGPFELIFLDINMPEMDGFEYLQELAARKLLGRTPIVIVSTEGSASDVERGLAAGAAQYLRKPFQAADLRAIVDKFISFEPSELEAAR